jgi:uncharacterized Zn-finger protein
MSDDLSSSYSDETVKPELPFVEPPLLDEVLEGLGRLELDKVDEPADVQNPDLSDISFPTSRDPSTLSFPSSSNFTNSTGLTEDISNTDSDYSFMMAYSTSNYPLLFDPALRDTVFGPENNYVDPKNNSVFSESFMFPDYSPQLPLQLPLEHDHVVRAQPDDRDVGISPHFLSTAFQSPPLAVPIDPPADAAPTIRDFTGAIRTKPMCDQCGRVFDRRSNMKSHMKTHDPNRERPFVCPESDCMYRFTRSNDLKRHLENINIHGIRAE